MIRAEEEIERIDGFLETKESFTKSSKKKSITQFVKNEFDADKGYGKHFQ